MESKVFQIEFTYQQVRYAGLAKPLERANQLWYSVDLESENQESRIQIIGRPATTTAEDWEFTCGEGEAATGYYDRALLEEIGEAIEKSMVEGSDAAKVG